MLYTQEEKQKLNIVSKEKGNMERVKIISNPYEQTISFFSFNEQADQWEDIKDRNVNSRLREYESGVHFLPFQIKEIVDTIIEEYYAGKDKVGIEFEGTQDEYVDIQNICEATDVADKVELSRSAVILENARVIFEPIKDVFGEVKPVIEKIVKDDDGIKKDLNKVSDALKDIIPICVFGNYSAGKSAFINAIIGEEILPSGDNPVTAKVYKIERSKFPDNARIKFEYKGEIIEILFENAEMRLIKGDYENELIKSIKDALDSIPDRDITASLRAAIKIINDYEKLNKNEVVISDEIDLSVPFSKNGIFGCSYNNFFIFDTPGSNSESNAEHYKVLQGALDGFSNGIPVWVTTYESLDSKDNANLCEDILDIKALDRRFTMIVMNKADGSDLDEGGFSAQKEQEILEYNSVEKMYSGGIYFVSSVLGLGSKNGGTFADNHYRKIYRTQQEVYSNPEDEDYATLYRYNIMPAQMKKDMVDSSENCENLLYANSGLYCVENEMEIFASKHAAYNKCEMVYTFLKSVIDETDRRITSKTESLKRNRELRRQELEKAKAELIDELHSVSETKEQEFEENSKNFLREKVASELVFEYTEEKLSGIVDEIYEGNKEERKFSVHEDGYESSKSKMLSNVKKNSMDILKGSGSLMDRLGKIKDDLTDDFENVKKSRKEMTEAESALDRETSDDIMAYVVEEYKKNVLTAQDILGRSIKEHWQQNTQLLRNSLIDIISGSEALNSTQREELSKIIINYHTVEFKDDAEETFVKPRYLRGNIFGIQIIEDEKLNIRKLANGYNNRMARTVNEIADDINGSCYGSFKIWEKSLAAVIEENITEYNPTLRDMTDLINEETERIAELEADQLAIKRSLTEIEDRMAWKNPKNFEIADIQVAD